jgi:hypothetical protein
MEATTTLAQGAGHIGNTLRLLGDTKMPWQECSKMDERLKFVARLLARGFVT